jgi:hypothetical protein
VVCEKPNLNLESIIFRIGAPGDSIARTHPGAAGNDDVAVAATALKCVTDKGLCPWREAYALQQTACTNMDCSAASLATSKRLLLLLLLLHLLFSIREIIKLN